MYNIEDYRDKAHSTILFEKGDLFVIQQVNPYPVGSMWMVSDGLDMVALGEKPELTVKSIQRILSEFKADKREADDDTDIDFTDPDDVLPEWN